jgi:hypothetical protein
MAVSAKRVRKLLLLEAPAEGSAGETVSLTVEDGVLRIGRETESTWGGLVIREVSAEGTTREGGHWMSENASEKRTQVLIIERGRSCHCSLVRVDGGYELRMQGCGKEQGSSYLRWYDYPCPHGSVVRELRAEDIPADLAAAALGLEESDLGVLCGEVRDPTPMGRWENAAIDNMREAYEMVRKANAEARGDSRA